MCTQGPRKEGTLGPARDKREGHRCGRQPDLHVPGRAGTQARLRASRLPGGSGPSRPPHAFSLPGTHGERAEAPELRSARGGRSGRTLRPPGPRAGAGTPGRRNQASPGPRRATLTASPWPGGRHSADSLLLLGRAPPRSLALPRGPRSQRPGLRPCAPPAASATRVPGSAAGGAAHGGTTRLQADRLARRSLGRRGGRFSRPRRWATAPPGPHVPLRRRDCGGRTGHERQGTRGNAAWGWRGPVRLAPPARLRPVARP